MASETLASYSIGHEEFHTTAVSGEEIRVHDAISESCHKDERDGRREGWKACR